MADVLVRNEGSILMLTPDSDSGREWIDENLGLESWQWLGNSCAIEWRYAPAIIEGMWEDGLEVTSEFANITDEDKEWLAELNITASNKEAVSSVPQGPQQAPHPGLIPQRPGMPPVVIDPQEGQEKRTIPPEIPYPRFHMAKHARGGWKRISNGSS